MSTTSPDAPSLIRYTLGFLLVGLAWGLTTPFIRRAALTYTPAPHPSLSHPSNQGFVRKRVLQAAFTVTDLLRSPSYALPLVVNLTGSVWFFLLIGKAGELVCGGVEAVGRGGERGEGRGGMGRWLGEKEGKGKGREGLMRGRGLIILGDRAESDGADYEFVGVPVYGVGGVVGGGEGH